MTTNAPINLSTSAGHAADYLGRANSIPHRTEGESAFLEFIPVNTRRILDLGTGDGRLLALVKSDLSRPESAPDIDPEVAAMAVDFSPAMLEAVRKRFAADSFVTIVADNLDHPLPALGKFDAIVSSLAIHHLLHERKRASFMPRFTAC
ncbi:MAG: class I SAM-dependent methyltransferase [Candidatus Sulfotelmatobacter sp.]